jgi:hypothetical protein
MDAGGNPVSTRFDVVSSETHEAITVITDHPVETGAVVSDHARDLPVTLAIEGFVSNAPLSSNWNVNFTLAPVQLTVAKPDAKLSLSSAVSAGVSALASAVGFSADPPPAVMVYTDPTGAYADRPRAMYEALEAARVSHALVKVHSRLTSLDNMVITRLSVPRSLSDGTGATFHMELRQIRLVTALSVAAPSQSPEDLRAALQKNVGSRAAQAASPAMKSAALQIVQKVGFLH